MNAVVHSRNRPYHKAWWILNGFPCLLHTFLEIMAFQDWCGCAHACVTIYLTNNTFLLCGFVIVVF